MIRLAIMPLFLFSGTFFPVTNLPGPLRSAVVLSPLWHGIELCRAATLGAAEFGSIVVHIAVLLTVIAAGASWGVRTFPARLTQ